MRTTRLLLASLVTILLVGAAGQAAANSVRGNLLGVFPGNDSEAEILLQLGLNVTRLARVNLPAISTDGLTLSNFTLNDDEEPISGDWAYAGPDTVDLLVLKAGNNFAVYEYNDVITGNMPNMGIWDTSDLSNKGLSHATAYQVVPEPAAAIFIALGLAGLAYEGRRRRRAAAPLRSPKAS